MQGSHHLAPSPCQLHHQPPLAGRAYKTPITIASSYRNQRCQHILNNLNSIRITSQAKPFKPAIKAASNEAPAAAGQAQRSLAFSTRIASSPAELRAAAYLRAQSFYVYPPDRSEWAARSHRRMKADSEWESLTAKVAGTEEFYRGVQVVAFVATVDDVPDQPQAQQVTAEVDPSTKLPAAPAAGMPFPQAVVGTLDINIGRTLPAEELQGKLPALDPSQDSIQGQGRAYLSNVCVTPAARRQGVAQALVGAVERYLEDLPVSHLYVHVVHDNKPAIQLYTKGLGFEIESEESENFAQAASRPKRLLLCKPLKH